GPLSSEEGRRAYLGLVGNDLRRYDRVVQASQELEAAIDNQVRAARNEMDAARRIQTRLSIVLAILALGATLAVGIVGRRLGDLVNEAEQRGEEALRARREMEAVLEASADGVIGMDLAGRCTSLNRTGSELLGISDHDAAGRTVHDLVHGKAVGKATHAPEACPILGALDAGVEQQEADDVVWRRDGTSFPGRWHLRPLVDGREVRGGVLTITDMTDVREAEAALRKAVRARDEMMAVVSHDLRNPLGTVAAAASLLADIPLSPEKGDEQIEIIRRASSRMSDLIDDLLDVARIDAGAFSIEAAPVEVGPLVEDAAAIFEPQAIEAGIELEARVEAGLPPILGDRERMEQALSNLLANALKFTPPGGRVDVTAARVERWVRLSVIDTGPGIAPESLAHLFDR
ncbi:MAG TPA: PAS domain-containing sensor histidine kinase, partial [Longimicrobiales bacterium]|nr:PAS domain-containing sensor histidine kinase [Longimicrobiales bacterium]